MKSLLKAMQFVLAMTYVGAGSALWQIFVRVIISNAVDAVISDELPFVVNVAIFLLLCVTFVSAFIILLKLADDVPRKFAEKCCGCPDATLTKWQSAVAVIIAAALLTVSYFYISTNVFYIIHAWAVIVLIVPGTIMEFAIEQQEEKSAKKAETNAEESAASGQHIDQ